MFLWILLILLFQTGISVFAAEEYSEGYFKYTIENDQVTITSYFGAESEVVIPDHLASLPVTKIQGNTFSRNRSITKLTIPETITEIGDGALKKLKSLKTVVVQTKSITVDAPEGCNVIEDYPVYVDPEESSGAEETTSPGQTDSGSTESAADGSKKNQGEQPTIPAGDHGYITVDDSGNLIYIDGNNNLAILDKNGGYTSSNSGGIIDPKGKLVSVNETGDEVTYSGADGNPITQKLDSVAYVTEEGRENRVSETAIALEEAGGTENETAESETAGTATKTETKSGTGAATAVVTVVVVLAVVIIGIVLFRRKQKKI